MRLRYRVCGLRGAAHYGLLLLRPVASWHRTHRIPGLCYDWRPV